MACCAPFLPAPSTAPWHLPAEPSLLRLSFVIGVAGATIYALQIPERWRPGKFDIWMSSHQLW